MGNDPVNRVDPYGLYICDAGKDCDRLEDDLDYLREAVKKLDPKKDAATIEAINASLAGFGARGQNNGVSVHFGQTRDKHGNLTGAYGNTAGTSAKRTITIDYGLIDKDYGKRFGGYVGMAAAAHEGRHAFDIKNNTFRNHINSEGQQTEGWFKGMEKHGYESQYFVYKIIGIFPPRQPRTIEEADSKGLDEGENESNAQ